MRTTLPTFIPGLRNGLRIGRILLVFLFVSQIMNAQNGAPCYQPVTGIAKRAYPVQGGLLCPNCTMITNIDNITDANKNNFASFTTASIAATNGISVIDSVNTFPAGWHAGLVVSIRSTTVSVNVLTSFIVQTWNNGVMQESKNMSNGLSVVVADGSSGKLFMNFKTTLSFDEVRFIFQAPVGAIDSFDIYYAMAFDPLCGLSDNNGICRDQMAGPSISVNNNLGLIAAFASLDNPENITDGDKTTFATLNLATGVSLLSNPPYVGVVEEEIIHPAGHKAGFVIGQTMNYLSVDVLNALSLRTYLHGQLQDSVNFSEGTGPLQVVAIADSPDMKEISLTTTLPFNELRLFVRQSVSVNVSNLKIYYAFESGPGCSECRDILHTGAAAPNTGTLNSSRTGTFGVVCLGQSLTNAENVVTPGTTDFATFTPAVLSVGCGARISVTNDGTDYPAGTFAGVSFSKAGGLADAALLSAITINVYKDGGTSPVASASGSALAGFSLLNGTGGLCTSGFKPAVAFDEIQVQFNSGLITAALDGTYRIYNLFVIRDDDHDGVADCMEVCGLAGNDAIDTDGDGTPDACDACNLQNAKSVYADTDGDGIVDACDADSDNDGIADASEDINNDGLPSNDDADGDGIPNYLDLDSDNDGIPDLYESGIPAAMIAAMDADHNAVIDAGVTKGANGMANAVESNDNASADVNYTIADIDSDGISDFVDLDSDNDGINDIVESGYTGLIDMNFDAMVDGPDTDRDGVSNSADGTPTRGVALVPSPADTDGDNVPDYHDLDSDNDLVSDLLESGQTGVVDADNDGVVDGPDADDDGIMDSVDGNDIAFGDQNVAPVLDTDNDGIPDFRDLDKNNDGIKDIVDIGLGWMDMDGDGDVDNPTDPDEDGIVNNNGSDTKPTTFGGLGASTQFFVKVLLQGGLVNPVTDVWMRDDLRQNNLIPLNQPYNTGLSPRFTTHESGSEFTTNTVLNSNAGTGNAIVDWVFIEIRNGVNGANVVRTVSGLLQRDGDVVGADGNKLGLMLSSGNYFLSVKHRNHLGIMTSTASLAANMTNNLNFINGSIIPNGTNAMKQTQPDVWAMWGGDVNADGQVYYTAPGNDRDALLLLLNGDQFGFTGTYNGGDMNLDAQTYYTAPGNDRDWLLANPMDGNEFAYTQEQIP